ncbi:MAG: hypothetical protein ABIR92_10110, partial [Gemmatimonadaceae bacterium]
QAPGGAIDVIVNGRTTTLTAADLRQLKRVSLRIADTRDSSTVSGISLWSVLEKVGSPAAVASGRQRASTYLKLTGADGVSGVIALVEVDPSFSKREVLIIDQRNSKALDPVEGPWRVIVPDDLRHARWIRNLKSITVETVPR